MWHYSHSKQHNHCMWYRIYLGGWLAHYLFVLIESVSSTFNLKDTWLPTRLFTKSTDSYLYLLHSKGTKSIDYWIGLGIIMCLHWKHAFLIIFLNPHSMFVIKWKFTITITITSVYHRIDSLVKNNNNSKLKTRTASRGEWFHKSEMCYIDTTLMNKNSSWPSQQCTNIDDRCATKFHGSPSIHTLLRKDLTLTNEIKSKGSIFTWSIIRLVRLFRWCSTNHIW